MIYSIKYLLLILIIAMPISSFSQPIILNKGIAGNNSGDLVARIDKDVIAEGADLVIIMVGTNDMINSHKLVSYSNYRDNYNLIISKLKDRGTKIVLMSLPPVDEKYVFKRHDASKYKEGLNVKIDSANSIVKKIARDESLYFMDLNSSFKSSGSPSRDSSSLIINEANFGIEDGIHPTKDGYMFMAEIIYTYLKKQTLLENNKKIICFGDSITYGSYMIGAGTAEGDTYPAVLSILIDNAGIY